MSEPTPLSQLLRPGSSSSDERSWPPENLHPWVTLSRRDIHQAKLRQALPRGWYVQTTVTNVDQYYDYLETYFTGDPAVPRAPLYSLPEFRNMCRVCRGSRYVKTRRSHEVIRCPRYDATSKRCLAR